MRFFIQTVMVLCVCATGQTIRTYNMEDYCSESISMILSSFKQGSIKLYTNNNFVIDSYPGQTIKNECEVTLEAWYTWDQIGFYFESLNLPCDDGHLVFYDNTRIIDGLSMVCDDVAHDGQYVATSRTLKIKYVGKTSKSYEYRDVMNLIVTAFHDGVCASYEYKCDSGRCIDDDLSCNKYKSCGYGDNCRLSGGAIAGIVIGALAGLTIIVIVAVMACCCLKTKRNPPATGGQVIYMAQAVPAVTMNTQAVPAVTMNTQAVPAMSTINALQPPAYSIAASQQPVPGGYYGNQGLQTSLEKQPPTTYNQTT